MRRGRNPAAREESVITADRERVAELRAEGYSLSEIVRIFTDDGRYYTSSMASGDERAIRKAWTNSRLPDTIAIIQEELYANGVMLNHAWRKYREAEEFLAGIVYIYEDEQDEDEQEIRRPSMTSRFRMRRQGFIEEKHWWNEIVRLRQDRAKLLGLTAASININFDNRQQNVIMDGAQDMPNKVYVGFDPERDWPSLPSTTGGELNEEEVVIDGEFENVG